MKTLYFLKMFALLSFSLITGFSVSAQPIGSTLAKPVQVGTLSPGIVFSDTKNNASANGYLNNIGNPSDDIYYKFTISSGAMVSISHCTSGFDTYLHLLNANGAVIASNDDSGDLCKGVLQASLKLQLAAGTYYAVSEGWGSNYGNIVTQISISAEEIDQGFSQQMSQIFAALETSRVPYGLLQDIALEQTNLSNYKGNLLADSNYVSKGEFQAVYQTLASARIHTNAPAFLPVRAVDSLTYLQREPGKIILSGLYYKYSRFTDNAVAANRITVANNQVYDKYIGGTWQDPYQTESAFAISPAGESYTGKSQQLLLPESLWFSNNGIAVSSLQVDAGDGLGYRTLTANQQLGLSYPDTGKKVITYKLNLTNGTALYSHSQIHIQSSVLESYPGVQTVPITATEAFNGSFAKGTMFIQYANPALGMQKPLIVAEGFDMGRILDPELAYGDNTMDEFLDEIKYYEGNLKTLLINNPQYDIVYVDWHEGTADIKKNAKLLKQVIREVNQRKALAGSTAKNVVMGISMGGLVARYALKEMENSNEPHHTKLYISYDSPHQGANVPLGYQFMAKHLSNLYINTGLTAILTEIGSLISGNGSPYSKLNLTDQPAARQMLINYVNKNYQIDNTVHNQWQSDLKAMGYPSGDAGSPIKKIAISNGSQCGTGQAIVPNDLLLNYNGKASTRFIGDLAGMFALPFAGAILNQRSLNWGVLPGKNDFKFEVQVNAGSTGASSQVYHNKISYTKKVLWLIPVTKTISDKTVSVGGMLPYDSFAGGFIDIGVNLGNSSDQNIFLKYNITASNKPTFGFIPTVSALDIGYGNAALTTADYQAKYLASAPPAAPKNTPFQNFITANTNSKLNEVHTVITEVNGNWLAAELQNTNAPSADCTLACANLVISGPSNLCTPAVYSIAGAPAGATVTWSATGAAAIMGANTGNSVMVMRLTGGNSTITAAINIAGCPTVYVKKTIAVTSLPVPTIQRSLTPYFDQNAITATATAAGALSYDWETTGGLLINGYASPQANLSGVVTISSPNGDPGTIRVRSNTSCGASQFAEICFSPASESLGNFQWLSYSNPLPGEPLVAQVDGLPNATAYQWYIDNTLIETTSSPSIYTHSWQCGEHGLGVVAVLDCGFSLPTGSYYWGLCSGGYNFNIYPNPANSELTVSFSIPSTGADKEKKVMRDFEIKLLDEQGRIVREAKNPANSRDIRVDTREIANGTYFLHIINGKEVIKKQVIIKH
ncbi:MAG: T9SS type A sorting domain-containing protein [Daejeonella sp.]